MKREYRMTFTILLFSVVLICGCEEKNNPESKTKDTIVTTGVLIWKCYLGKGKTLDIEMLLFPKSNFIDIGYSKAKDIYIEELKYVQKMSKLAPTEEQRRSYEEEIRLKETGEWPWKLADSWGEWSMVHLVPIFQSGTKTKSIVFCRYAKRPNDIAFTIVSSEETNYKTQLDCIKQLSKQLEQMSNKEWAEFPVSQQSFYDQEKKELVDENLLEFTKDAVFLEQH